MLPSTCRNRRPRPHLLVAIRALTMVVRLHEKWIEELPEYFDLKYIAMKKREKEEERPREEWSNDFEAVLNRVYGLKAATDPISSFSKSPTASANQNFTAQK
jgi:hypothetical protein